MKSRKGFTLIELMVVVVIVAVLAALIIPLLLSRVEKARYSEGKAIASEIATAVRAYAAEADTINPAPALVTDLGFQSAELDARWFKQGGMSVSGLALDSTTGRVSYTITLIPFDTNKLSHGNVVLNCDPTQNPSSWFSSPTGL